MNDFFLIHGGPGSGRYPLGSGNRPYQKFEKAKKKISSVRKYIKTKKNQKEEKKRRIAENESQKRKTFHEANKEKVLRKGSARDVLKYQGELTNEELQKAYTRLNLEANIRSLSAKEKDKNKLRVDKLMKNIKTGNEWVELGTRTYNNFAAVYNATPDGRNNPLTMIKKS